MPSDAAQESGASERIERLLGELRASAGPLQWPRIEELMCALMDLYTRGLGRLFDHLEAAHALDDRLRRLLADDELVASLLGLHGLHPLPIEARIRRALEGVSAQLGPIELVAVDGGVVRLRLRDAPRFAGVAELLECVVLEAAPELEKVHMEGLRTEASGPSAQSTGPLVQIDLSRSRLRAGTAR